MSVRHAFIGVGATLLLASAAAATVSSATALTSRSPDARFIQHTIDSGLDCETHHSEESGHLHGLALTASSGVCLVRGYSGYFRGGR